MSAKCIMVQGTASSVGKSIITAGFCRIFKQDGFKVAPFKSQNMALNSFVTKEGKEMGRAQVVQAEAAGVSPGVRMNPILLKPTGDKKSQVIINGEVYGNMTAMEYHDFKPRLLDMIKDVYDELKRDNDIIVIEGAGSPAEINLRDKDLVNMGMAEIADSPVVLVGDIDKGGVFASIVGTMSLLKGSERERVKGVIINKFRGDIEILRPGLKMLEDIIKVPVLGVVPYFNFNIEDEDSLAEKFSNQKAKRDFILDIVVIKLPHMSNFSDFNALERISEADVRFAEYAHEIGIPDMLIIPGSKNTIEDLMFIQKCGIAEKIVGLARQGVVIFGICGGYQMLGDLIEDPDKIESDIGSAKGLGLLNTKTELKKSKFLKQVEGYISDDSSSILRGLKGTHIKGYEIHMGYTECIDSDRSFISMKEGEQGVGGISNDTGNVLGTYIHGIFDNDQFTFGVISNLRSSKGFSGEMGLLCSFDDFKQKQYDSLADTLRNSLDMEEIWKIINGG